MIWRGGSTVADRCKMQRLTRLRVPGQARMAVSVAALFLLECTTKTSRPPGQGAGGSVDGRSGEPAARVPGASGARAAVPTPYDAVGEAQGTAQPRAPAIHAATPGVDWTKELIALPDRVLVGTDVVPLASFSSQAAPIPLAGVFRSEQGGAAAEIRLEAGPKGPTITREFAEPGTVSQVERYEALRVRAHGTRLSGKGLEVLGTSQSILVLEKSSGVDGIPDSLWIEYDLTPSKAPARGN